MSLPKRFRSNQLVMVAYELLNERRIVIGMDSIKHPDPVPVEEFPPDRVVSERSGKWQVLVLVLERLSVIVSKVWGEAEVKVFANWMSQIHYIGLYDWDAAKRDYCLGKVFDYSHNPVMHLGARDEKSIHHMVPDIFRSDLDKMARVIFHELFHIAAPMHTGIDRAEYERTYLTYFLTGEDLGLSRLAFEDGELLAWVMELTTFGDVSANY